MSGLTDRLRLRNDMDFSDDFGDVFTWSVIASMLDVIDAVEDIAPGYDGHEGPYLDGVRADEMQAVNVALARFREVAS